MPETIQPDPSRHDAKISARIAHKMLKAYRKFITQPGGIKPTDQIEFDKQQLISWLTSPVLADADKIRITFGFYDEEVSDELNLDAARRNRPTVLFWPYRGNAPLPKPTVGNDILQNDPGDGEEDAFNMGQAKP